MPNASGALWGPARKKWAPKIKVLRKKASEDLTLEPANVHLILWVHLLLGVDMFLSFPRSFSIIQRFKHCSMKEKTDTERFRSLLQTALFSLKMKVPHEKI